MGWLTLFVCTEVFVSLLGLICLSNKFSYLKTGVLFVVTNVYILFFVLALDPCWVCGVKVVLKH